ncbi:MAG: dehydrogenase, partial [Burkholderiaceae bacterium]|nr:dehydrogenase [Burkholderiaceae bacterium]
EKVREIYQLGLKHGMKLAAISGVHGVITDEQIARVRELALAARAKQPAASARSTARRRAPAPDVADAVAASDAPTAASGRARKAGAPARVRAPRRAQPAK